MIVREFQNVIGEETIAQLSTVGVSRPDAVVACVGGGSNAIGMFHPFIRDIAPDSRPDLIGAEAAGKGVDSGLTGASIALGEPGVMHGFYSYLLQDERGNPEEAYSISAGLDYPGIGPQHAHLSDEGLVRYEPVTDTEALTAFDLLCKTEGIIPAIESAHALALLPRLAEELRSRCGRGREPLRTRRQGHRHRAGGRSW